MNLQVLHLLFLQIFLQNRLFVAPFAGGGGARPATLAS